MFANVCYIVVTPLFYGMFEPVNGRLSLFEALCGLAGCTIATIGTLHLARLPIGPSWFFALFCITIAYLIIRSTFLPPIFGMLMACAGFGWLIFLSPLGSRLSSIIEFLVVVAELAPMVRLLAIGVNTQRWNELVSKRREDELASRPRTPA